MLKKRSASTGFQSLKHAGVVFVLTALSAQAEPAVKVTLHPQAGDPEILWTSTPEARYTVVRQEEASPQKEEEVVATGVQGGQYFDHHTTAGKTYRYKVLQETDDALRDVGEGSVTSAKRYYSVEGKFPLIMGWADDPEILEEMGINLVLSNNRQGADRFYEPGEHGGKRRIYSLMRTVANPSSLKLERQDLDNKVREARQGPGTWGFFIYDESWDYVREKTKVRRLRQHNTDVPTFANATNLASVLSNMSLVTDIATTEHYFSHATFPHAMIPLAEARINPLQDGKLYLTGSARFKTTSSISSDDLALLSSGKLSEEDPFTEIAIPGCIGTKEAASEGEVGIYRFDFSVPDGVDIAQAKLHLDPGLQDVAVACNGATVNAKKDAAAWIASLGETLRSGENTLVVAAKNPEAKESLPDSTFARSGHLGATPPWISLNAPDGNAYAAPPGRPLMLCMDVATETTISRNEPESFLTVGVMSALAQGVKGVYYWNWTAMVDAMGSKNAPRQRETIARLNALILPLGPLLLEARFQETLENDSPVDASYLGKGNHWTHQAGYWPRFRQLSKEPVPRVTTTLLQGNQYNLIFAVVGPESGYSAEDVQVRLPESIRQRKAYEVTPDGLVAQEAVDGKLPLGVVREAKIFLLTDSEEILSETKARLEEWKPLYLKATLANTRQNLSATETLMEVFPGGGDFPEEMETEKTAIQAALENKELSAVEASQWRFASQKLFEKARKSYQAREKPYRDAPGSAWNEAVDTKSQDPLPKAENHADYRNGARASASFDWYRFKIDPGDARLVLGEGAKTDDEWLRRKQGTWGARTNVLEPYPALTIKLPQKQPLGSLRIRLPDYAESQKFVAGELSGGKHIISRVAVEFPQTGKAFLFHLKPTANYQKLAFPTQEASEVRVVILEVTPETLGLADDFAGVAIDHIELAGPGQAAAKAPSVPLSPLTQTHYLGQLHW